MSSVLPEEGVKDSGVQADSMRMRLLQLVLGTIAAITAIMTLILEIYTLWIVFFIFFTLYSLTTINYRRARREVKYLLAPIAVLIMSLWTVSLLHPILKEWSEYGSYTINAFLIVLAPALTILVMRRLGWRVQ